jgi:hypothetical protein
LQSILISLEYKKITFFFKEKGLIFIYTKEMPYLFLINY